jgi:hypothetical protein
MSKLSRLKEEQEQVVRFLQSSRLSPETRYVLTKLKEDLDRQLDEELTRVLSPGGSHAA